MVRKQIRRITVLVLGWTLIGFGIIGLFLPILQGVLFILLGLYVLSRESETARVWLHNLRERHPAVDAKLNRWSQWWRRRFRRIEDDASAARDE